MMRADNCLDIPTFERMLAGQLADAEAEKACAHLERCKRCFEAVRNLPEDTIVASLRARGNWPAAAVEPAFIRDLVQKILHQSGQESPPILASDPATREEAVTETLPPTDFRAAGATDASTEPPAFPLSAQGRNRESSRGSAQTIGVAEPIPEATVLDDDGPLPSIPGYEVLGTLGRGGMGVVYKARQIGLRRLVALKMILAGSYAGEQERSRFLLEAKAVASLQHRNIVQIHQIGEHDGLPYFSLEFCAGGSLAQKMNGTPLPPKDAAMIVATLAEAMQAAHAAGIIHRDLKPANILLQIADRKLQIDKPADPGFQSAICILQSAIPKITDFGLAKELGEVGQTASGAIMGTPSYMAPEQAGGASGALGPPADIYALGAILYECLTGRPPFKAATALETVFQVVNAEPVPPSQLIPRVPRDLETICMKCLQKDPAKRFATAADLADDLNRFLDGEPIRARPVGRVERTWRWCRRNPLVAGLLGTVAATLILGTVVAWTFALRAEADSQRADWEKSRALANEQVAKDREQDALNEKAIAEKAAAAEKLATQKALAAAEAEGKALAIAKKRLAQLEKANWILGSIFRDIDPRAEEKGGPHLLEQLGKRLEESADDLDVDLIDDPKTLGRMQALLGLTLSSLGNAKKAIELLTKARGALEVSLGPDHPDTLMSINNLALAYHRDGQFAKALPLYQESLAKTKAKFGPDHARTLNGMNNLAGVYESAGHLAKALPLLEEVFQKRKAALGPDHPDTLGAMHNLAYAYHQDGQLARALPMFEEALAKRTAALGPDHTYTLRSMEMLAAAYIADEQLARALPLFEEALAKTKAKLGPDHPETLHTMNNLGAAYSRNGQAAKAFALYEEALAKQKIKPGPDHPSTLLTMENLASAYQNAGQFPAALSLYEKTLAKMRTVLGPDHPKTLHCANQLALAYRANGQLAKALPIYEETLAKTIAKFGPDHATTLTGMNNLAEMYRAEGKLAKAMPLHEETLAKRKAEFGADHPDTLVSMNNLALTYHEAGQSTKAVPLYEQALAKMKARLGPDHPSTLTCMSNLAQAYEGAQQLTRAQLLHEAALAKRKVRLGLDHPDTLTSMSHLAHAYQKTRQWGKAVPLLEEALAKSKVKLGPDHADTLKTMNNLAAAYHTSGQLPRAFPLYEDALAKQKAKFGPDHPETQRTMANLAEAYRASGQHARVTPLYEVLLPNKKAKLGPDDPDTLLIMYNLASSYHLSGQLAKALPLYEETLARMKAKLGPEDPKTQTTVNNLSVAYYASGEYVKALPLFEEVLTYKKAKLGPEHADTLNALSNLGAMYLRTKNPSKALPLLDEFAKTRRKQLGAADPRLVAVLAPIGSDLLKYGQHATAESFLRECLEIQGKSQPNAWATFNMKSMLGGSLLGQKKYAEAEPLLKEGYEGLKQREKTMTPQTRPRLTEALERLVQLCDATGQTAEADRCRKELAARSAAEKGPKK
jgi:eukaryotic-like serine/threonine-protein kinase